MRESIVDTAEVDPRVRGEDEVWSTASLFRHSREGGNPSRVRGDDENKCGDDSFWGDGVPAIA
jgi:hypothetical protein